MTVTHTEEMGIGQPESSEHFSSSFESSDLYYLYTIEGRKAVEHSSCRQQQRLDRRETDYGAGDGRQWQAEPGVLRLVILALIANLYNYAFACKIDHFVKNDSRMVSGGSRMPDE